MGPTIANSACTTLAVSNSNEVKKLVGTSANQKNCSFVHFTEQERSDCTPESGKLERFLLEVAHFAIALVRTVAALLFCNAGGLKL